MEPGGNLHLLASINCVPHAACHRASRVGVSRVLFLIHATGICSTISSLLASQYSLFPLQ
jgi:hypothetical protein